MMRKICYLLFLSFITFSCSFTEKPEFINIENVRVQSANLSKIVINADAVFENLNDIGGNLELKNLEVFANNVKVSTINSKKFNVPIKDKFSIPIKVSFSPKQIFDDQKKGLLSNIFNSIANKEVVLDYKGVITYSLGDFSYDYNINYSDKVVLKKR
ncbi:MAG: hypothetical protein KAJ28_05975 [Flavobacteriaceae bacterium]|nr:hypothetical protein [Flavobacteriaceae bacterium]